MPHDLSLRDRIQLRKLRRCERVVIVAHPDDETLWCGKTIAEHPGTSVLCLTNRRDRPRRRAFYSALKELGAVGVILDIPDRRSEPASDADERRLHSTVSYILEPLRSMTIFTHGPEGEYGHPLHRRVSEIVSSIAGQASGIEVWFFDFQPATNPLPPLQPHAKVAALSAYFPNFEKAQESDREHLMLSALESPTLSSDYRGSSSAIDVIYGKSQPR